jgi:hypothetical protein
MKPFQNSELCDLCVFVVNNPQRECNTLMTEEPHSRSKGLKNLRNFTPETFGAV